MIINRLERLAKQVFINIISRLCRRQVRACLFFQRSGVQRQESCIATAYLQAAGFALAEVVTHRQQLRDLQLPPPITLELFPGQMFDQVPSNLTARFEGRLSYE